MWKFYEILGLLVIAYACGLGGVEFLSKGNTWGGIALLGPSILVIISMACLLARRIVSEFYLSRLYRDLPGFLAVRLQQSLDLFAGFRLQGKIIPINRSVKFKEVLNTGSGTFDEASINRQLYYILPDKIRARNAKEVDFIVFLDWFDEVAGHYPTCAEGGDIPAIAIVCKISIIDRYSQLIKHVGKITRQPPKSVELIDGKGLASPTHDHNLEGAVRKYLVDLTTCKPATSNSIGIATRK